MGLEESTFEQVLQSIVQCIVCLPPVSGDEGVRSQLIDHIAYCVEYLTELVAAGNNAIHSMSSKDTTGSLIFHRLIDTVDIINRAVRHATCDALAYFSNQMGGG